MRYTHRRSQHAELLIWNTKIQRSIDAYWSQPIFSPPVCEVCGFTSRPAIYRECAAA